MSHDARQCAHGWAFMSPYDPTPVVPTIANRTLQRAAINPSPVHDVPPIVHDVLRSPGKPLDAAMGAFMDPCSGHDFSRIPTHSLAIRVIQTKLAINKPGDEYEQEADRVADQVLAASAHSVVGGAPPRIRRYAGQATEGPTAPASVDRVLTGSGRPLDSALRQDMEQRFGHDFSQVRVQTGGAAEQSAREVNAHAYTVGHNIVFGAGRFAPGAHEGQRLIAHELTHVVQQSGSNGIRLDQSDDKRGLFPIALKQPIAQLKCPACEKEEDNQLRRKESDDQASNCGPGTADPFCLRFPPSSPDVPCEPFPSVEEALSTKALLSNTVPSGAAAITQCGEVKPVWDTYFAATSTPFSFSSPSSCVVSAAKTDPDGSNTANRAANFHLDDILDNLPITLRGITPSPLSVIGPVAERRLPLEEAIKPHGPRFLHPRIDYTTVKNAAANIAGGVGLGGQGSDLFGDDDRLIGGPVVIEVATIDPESGMMAGQVRWQPHVHVKDTADFCPGKLGTTFTKLFAIPMSKLESMGLTRDVPITIDYDLDVRRANFNNVQPLIGPPPRPRPTLPVPTPPISPPPQSDSQFRSRRFAGQPTLEACGNGKHRMFRGDSDLEAVKKVQETLGEAGIPVKVDGVFGEETEQAVAKFKREHSPQIVPSDGVVGPKTSHALDDVAIKQGQ